MLLLTAMIWGGAFVAQSEGMNHLGPFTFQALRQVLGFLVLLPVIFIQKKNRPKATKQETKKLLLCALACGAILFVACSLQQLGISMGISAGKSGFITALYIVLVPIAGTILGKKPGINVWIAMVIAFVGLYFLCMDGSWSIGIGELLTLGCALFFTAHIVFVDRVCGDVDGVKLSALQFLVCGLLSVPYMLFTESVSAKNIAECWLPIAYAGVLSCGVAYTLQIIAQKITDPTVASITMSMESVFAVLFGWVLLRQQLGNREILGCVLMFCAVLLAQIPLRKRAKATL